MQVAILRRVVTAAAVALTGLVAATAPVFAQTYASGVIVSGLDNPRGMAFGADGALYITEAGRGGTGPSVTEITGAVVSYGATGAVTRWTPGSTTKAVTGLASLANQPGGGNEAIGLVDMVWSGGEAYGVFGWVGAGAQRTEFANNGGDGTRFGRLARLTTGGVFTSTPTYLADFAAYEQANNPEPTDVNSNPYSLAVSPTGFVVSDAGGNTVYNLNTAGAISSILTTFPSVPNPLFGTVGGPTRQVVPTTVVYDAGSGDFFVGQLTGFPFPVGDANIYRVTPGGVVSTVPGGGLTNVIDMVMGPDGKLYALQFNTNGLLAGPGAGPGQIVKVDPITGVRETLQFAGGNPLTTPGGLAFGQDGALYVSNFSTSAGGGQVLRVVAVPEPGTGALVALAGSGLLGLAVIRRRKG